MPHIVLYEWTGKSEQKKQEIAKALATALMEATGVPDFAISVDYVDVEQEQWADKVKDVHITPNMDRLIIKPKTNKEDW